MLRSTKLIPVPFLALALALAGCTATPSESPQTAAEAKAAAQFVACLTAQGQTAKILDSGQVGVLLPEGVGPDAGRDQGGGTGGVTKSDSDGGDDGPTAISMTKDADGTWMASDAANGYPEEGGIRDAWTECETTVPKFKQPAPKIDGADVQSVTKEDQEKASLAFAKCARTNGYADFADPASDGQLEFPFGMTEDEFRTLVTACSESIQEIGLPISQDSIDSFDFDWMAVLEELEIGSSKHVTRDSGDSGSNGDSN